MQAWCEALENHNARQPRLCFDTVCIDQSNTEEDLICVPVFSRGLQITGCHRQANISHQLVVLAGAFCAPEHGDLRPITQAPQTISMLGANRAARDQARDAWRNFVST